MSYWTVSRPVDSGENTGLRSEGLWILGFGCFDTHFCFCQNMRHPFVWGMLQRNNHPISKWTDILTIYSFENVQQQHESGSVGCFNLHKDKGFRCSWYLPCWGCVHHTQFSGSIFLTGFDCHQSGRWDAVNGSRWWQMLLLLWWWRRRWWWWLFCRWRGGFNHWIYYT